MAEPTELDAAALELLEALETLHQRRQFLTQLLRQGWLSLSQARYSLGWHRVSALQYGATMAPRVRVLHRQELGGSPRFEEVPGTEPEAQLGGDGLRQRRGPPEKGGAAPARAPPDPLAWFGVLVPPSLRQAQGCFVQGVTVAVELAGLQGAVMAAATRYRALLRRGGGESGDSEGEGDDGEKDGGGDVKGDGGGKSDAAETAGDAATR
ncbi:coiled-coil domain-containing protein 115 [Grus americana]|uniref:coiled-coil domain-containing protein 115 n=1 Tax=Grus americana TaxID=9117 RepID=UPI002407CCD9|nr:coiled-coil domain-containing protein 115 [Grus americana]